MRGVEWLAHPTSQCHATPGPAPKFLYRRSRSVATRTSWSLLWQCWHRDDRVRALPYACTVVLRTSERKRLAMASVVLYKRKKLRERRAHFKREVIRKSHLQRLRTPSSHQSDSSHLAANPLLLPAELPYLVTPSPSTAAFTPIGRLLFTLGAGPDVLPSLFLISSRHQDTPCRCALDSSALFGAAHSSQKLRRAPAREPTLAPLDRFGPWLVPSNKGEEYGPT